MEKSGKRDDWYKRGGDEAVIFVLVTPGSQLQKKYQSEIRNQGYKDKGSGKDRHNTEENATKVQSVQTAKVWERKLPAL